MTGESQDFLCRAVVFQFDDVDVVFSLDGYVDTAVEENREIAEKLFREFGGYEEKHYLCKESSGLPMEKRDILNRIEYIVVCIGAFAQSYGLSNTQAYAYLRRYAGIEFLFDCYEAEHTLSIDDAVADLQAICYREGGRIS